MNDKENFSCTPPRHADAPGGFQAAFRHGYDRGAGRELDAGQPVPWTVHALEAAFLDRGRDISIKTLENWRAGRVRPTRRNILLLADIFAGGRRALREDWIDALNGKPDPAAPVSVPVVVPVVAPVAEPDGVPTATPPRVSHQWLFAAVLGALVIAGGILIALKPDRYALGDLRFCTPDHFDQAKGRCTRAQTRFATGTPRIHASFETGNMPDGQPFERRWYRNGEMFLQRDGFFDAAWENWTWLGNPNGHDPGTYHLRIIVEGRTTTGEFTVAGGQSGNDAEE